MNKTFFSKCLFLLIILSILGLSPGLRAEDDDFEFYKKNGHSNKTWNDYVKKGFEAYDQQNCNDTLTYLKQAVAAQCQDGIVYFKLAVCSELSDSPYTALQYYQLADEKLQKLSAIHRYQKEIYENYGRALFKAKRFPEAFPYLNRAAAVGTPSFGLYYMVGFLFAQKGDMAASSDYFNRALGMDTSKVPPDLLGNVYREVAKAAIKNKDYPTAAKFLDKAVQFNPKDEEAIKLKNETSSALQSQSMVQMIQTLTTEQSKGPSSLSSPPPPAAANLPALESQLMKDSNPPLGTVIPESSRMTPTGTTPTSPGTQDSKILPPLPPAAPSSTKTPPPNTSRKLEPLPPAW